MFLLQQESPTLTVDTAEPMFFLLYPAQAEDAAERRGRKGHFLPEYIATYDEIVNKAKDRRQSVPKKTRLSKASKEQILKEREDTLRARKGLEVALQEIEARERTETDQLLLKQRREAILEELRFIQLLLMEEEEALLLISLL